MRTLAIVFLLLASLNFTRDDGKIPDEGFIAVAGGKVWYKIIGAERKKTPVILLHGGPGFPSNYLKPLKALASDRPVIFYDQLGCGRSDKPEDTTLWNVKRFSDELSTIRSELGLKRIHLYAHSWGTMLAAEYLATHPKGIESIIFASPIFSTTQHLQNVNELKLSLPSNVKDTLLFRERNGTINSQAYQRAYGEYVIRHWCRIYPFPDEINESSAHFGNTVFKTMWGQYEFYCPGNLKDFERTAELIKIKVPTLFTCGRYDVITPESTAGYSEKVKGSELVVFENSAHMTMNEEPERYVKVIREFLNKIE
jgi:proline iminopeptidase